MTDHSESNLRKRIGLLGGSFNPAHRGHLLISQHALERLRLDEVWWIVSPQNPLKGTADMSDFAERIDSARTVTNDRRIRISNIENELGTVYTADTLAALKKHHPKARFVWLMGADNLLQISQWKNWEKIFRIVPIAIFPRPSYSKKALTGVAAQRFARYRIDENQADRLAVMQPPAWAVLDIKPDAISATRIRAGRSAVKI